LALAFDVVLPFLEQEHRQLPLIQVGLQVGGGPLHPFHALVDTGAEANLFDSLAAEAIGIDPGRGADRVIPVAGVTGSGGLYAYVHAVTLYVGTPRRFRALATEVAFTPPDIPLPFNLLGQRGFLDRLRVGVRAGAAPPQIYLGFAP
jgi:hypothetical protein